MIILLFISLFYLLFVSYEFNEKEVVAPSFIFTLSFCFCACWAVAYAGKWGLKLHVNTFLVIFLGILEYNIVTFFIRKTMRQRIKQYFSDLPQTSLTPVSHTRKILAILFQIGAILYSVKIVTGISIAHGTGTQLADAMRTYDLLTKFSDTVLHTPKLFTYSRLFCRALGYWFVFTVTYQYFARKKFDITGIIIVILSIICECLLGGRNQAFNIIISFIPATVYVYEKTTSRKFRLTLRTSIFFILGLVIVIFSFQTIGRILGGKTELVEDTLDYLAKYCGAQIENLDSFLETDHSAVSEGKFWGSQTFIYMIRWLGPRFGLKNTYYQLDLPFNYANGYSLGNVYTTFYPYIYDFGYIGCFLLIFLMAVVMQVVYECYRNVNMLHYPPFPVILYNYMFNANVLSFFSNKFYEQYCQKSFVILLLIFLLFPFLFTKVRIKMKS